MKIKKLFLLLVFLWLLTITPCAAMTIEEAYQAIPHRQTVFDVNAGKMASAEKKFLREFFQLIDLAMVERVEMLIWLSADGQKGKIETQYDDILAQLKNLTPPQQLHEAHQLVISAIEDHRSFLYEWKEAGFPKYKSGFRSHARVAGASGKLIKAYNLIMTAYPQETAHNKQAFFDYLCALDFL